MAQAVSARHSAKLIRCSEGLEELFDTLDHPFQRPQLPMESAPLFRRVLGKEDLLQGRRAARSKGNLATFLADRFDYDIRRRLEP